MLVIVGSVPSHHDYYYASFQQDVLLQWSLCSSLLSDAERRLGEVWCHLCHLFHWIRTM